MTILQKEKEFENSVGKVQSIKDKMTSTFAEKMKQQKEIQEKEEQKQAIIKQEVKEVIRKNPKLIMETVDMSKSVIIIGKKEGDFQNKLQKDKAD